MASAKRASTTAKLTKSGYVALVAFMVANHCGVIVRLNGVEYAAHVKGDSIIVERDDSEGGNIVMFYDECKLFTIRKGWNSDSLMQGLAAGYDRWIAGASADQWEPTEDYRNWESAYAYELWRMDCPDMLAYA